MSAPTKKIKRFLESALARSEDLEIVLYTVNVAGRKAEVWNSDKRWVVDDAAAQIVESAQGTADGQQGVTRFTLQAFGPEYGRSKALATMSFACQSEDAGEGDTPLSEPADRDGLLSQLMRHNENLHRQSSGTWGLMFQYMTRIIERQSEQLEKLQTEKTQSAEMMETLISKKHQREMETKQLEAEQKRKDEFFQKIMTLLPVAVNKLAGKELIHQKDSMLEVVSQEFVNSLSGNKLDAILQSGLFDKHQLTLLVTMLEQVSKRMVTPEEKQDSSKLAANSVFSGLGKLITTGVG
jgi:hypothetical protein